MFSALCRRRHESLKLIENAWTTSPIGIMAHMPDEGHELAPFRACRYSSLQCCFDETVASSHRVYDLNGMQRWSSNLSFSGYWICLTSGNQSHFFALNDDACKRGIDQ